MTVQALIKKLVPTLYEDDQLLAVAKPAGVDVGGLAGQSAARGLVETLGRVRRQGESLQPANRLGRYESGVLLLGKEPDIVRHIRAGLKSRRITQEYVAIVAGRMKKKRLQITVDGGGSRGRGRTRPKRKTSSREDQPADFATSVEHLRDGGERTLVRCTAKVENTHALRAQLRSAALPPLGDQRGGRRGEPNRARQEAAQATHLHLAKVAFHHPGREKKISITAPLPPGFAEALEGKRDEERVLRASLVRRLECLLDRDTNAFRLLSGQADGLPGLVVEKYADVGIVQIFEGHKPVDRSLPPKVAKWYNRMLDLRAVYVKPFVKDRTATFDAVHQRLCSPEPLVGEPVEPEIVIREKELRFAIKPYDGFAVGLFLDQRENRQRVRAMAKGKDVLNLFAYTCGFSVAAAAGGAKSTVSVDLSLKSLEWGKANFALNGLDLSAHRFIRSDAFEYFKRGRRQEQGFDLIVVDAPSFAHGRKRGRSFSIKTDMPALLEGALSLLNHDGVLMLSTNHRRVSIPQLRERVAEAAGRRRFRVISTPPLPVDFATDPEHAKTIFVRFS